MAHNITGYQSIAEITVYGLNAESRRKAYERYSRVRLTAGYRRDAVLAYKWNFEGSRFECEWN